MNRKKQSTSYKRPGPPTPSKIAGHQRQSTGGRNDINYTNVLKDSTNMDKKTPTTRFKNLFTGGSKSKDEVSYKNDFITD